MIQRYNEGVGLIDCYRNFTFIFNLLNFKMILDI